MTEERKAQGASGSPRRAFLKGSAAVVAGAILNTPLAGRPLLGDLRSLALAQTEALSVTDAQFGAVGDGVANDRAAFQAAIETAIKQKRPLLIPAPANFYRIELDAQHPQLMVNGHLEIVGEGRTTTLIRFSIPNPGANKLYAGFFIPNGRRFRIADLRLEEDAQARDYEFMGFHFQPGTRDHAVTIERVDVDGFTIVVYSPSSGEGDSTGETFITIRSCDFKPDWRYCVGMWTVEYGHKRLHCYDCYFHDNKDSHLVYTHPHNSVHIENCRFDGATSWAFHFQGSTVAGDPEYQRFIGCWFGSRNSRSIITQRRDKVNPLVEVRNCVFEGRPAIQIRSDIIIDGCYFTTPVEPPPSTGFVGAYDDAPWKAEITNCIFALRTGALPAIDMRIEDIEVVIENCQFYGQTSSTMLALGSSSANTYEISNCLFYTRPGESNFSRVVELDNGQATFRRCRFVGPTPRDRGVILLLSSDIGPGPETRIQLDDCLFHSISGGSLFWAEVEGSADWSKRIFGSNNRITNLITPKPLLVVEPSNAPVYGYLNPVSERAPAPITAGSMLLITSNYDQYEVLGTADVTFIHWWYPDGLSNALFSGIITLASVTGFTLVAGGNIDLGGASAQAVPAGTEVRLFYEPSEAKWTILGS